MSLDSEITSCHQISQRQQRLLMQCYCKKEYNTLFVRYYRADAVVVCTRMDKHMYKFNATEVCRNHRKYHCTGVNIGAASSSVSFTKLYIV
ncbi:hypothetical protein FB639_005152, partial [Coemansia asiatica]